MTSLLELYLTSLSEYLLNSSSGKATYILVQNVFRVTELQLEDAIDAIEECILVFNGFDPKQEREHNVGIMGAKLLLKKIQNDMLTNDD